MKTMNFKIKELEDKTIKLKWDMFKDKEVVNLISHMLNTTKVLFEESHNIKAEF